MRFCIRHEIRGRMRIHLMQKNMTCRQADLLQYALEQESAVVSVKVYERTADAVIVYDAHGCGRKAVGARRVSGAADKAKSRPASMMNDGHKQNGAAARHAAGRATSPADPMAEARQAVIRAVLSFHYKEAEEAAPESYLQNTGRELGREYFDRIVGQAVRRLGSRLFFPAPLRAGIACVKAVPYLWKGVRTLAAGKIEVPVLDAAAIGVSIVRGDYDTAGSVMFLLGIGETLEEWTHKRSVDDLARSMSLNIHKVWMRRDGQEVLVAANEIQAGDEVVVRMGNVIPFDGIVTDGEAMVNQASLTGEGLPVRKTTDGAVYAGTVVEEGQIALRVERTGGSSRFEKIVKMIEESEKLKSTLESRAEHLADRLVPYTFGAAALTGLVTRNATKAVAVLMVDFSCALKLAMPISVLSAIREASRHSVTVKGGRFLEAIASADTIVFDKTGTLTKAKPTVVSVVPFGGTDPDEMLRTAACMEEHFPHSMARAVVEAAEKKGLTHEEKHSTVDYIVAHGISTMVDGKKMVIGSHHFVFEDEGCIIPEGEQEKFDALPPEYSHLYLAIENVLAAVICIEDPLRPEAAGALKRLREAGIGKIVMMTGDSGRTARAVAARVGVDEYYAEVLPEDKACFVEQEKKQGHSVIMVGDGINDSPALSAADVGIAISDGAELAREIADVTVGADDLEELLTLKLLSNALMRRIRSNYRVIVGFNTMLIALGTLGVLAPTTSALLHNTSTLLIGMHSMKDLL